MQATKNTLMAGRRGFSLIELVIVVVIIGIIGAIAIPRMSRGASGAADASLTADLAVLRNAIDLYETEHPGSYPLLATFEAQLTTFTDADGDAQDAKDPTHIYGPYLRAIPKRKVGAAKGSNAVVAAYAAGNGWIYTVGTGEITACTAAGDADAANVDYVDY